ncbi:MAG: hypothetical protein EON58_06265, partial [Alphaproteobacteria bacterium]
MRYWKPSAALGELISGYHLYGVHALHGQLHHDVFQPAWANLRFLLTPDSDWHVRIRTSGWQPVPHCALFGPSSHVTWSRGGSGVVVGIGLTPLGWARFNKEKAADWANRVGYCDALFGAKLAQFRSHLCEAVDDETVPSLLDAFLIPAMGIPTDLDTVVVTLDTALLDPDTVTVRALAARVGVSVRSLERLAERAFGFPPKLLLRRA